ncbi:MAG: hypothetical protein IJU14_06785, partial [Clostridia bacterium]|nr:hypothetical protein [Clostridia bacterium]
MKKENKVQNNKVVTKIFALVTAFYIKGLLPFKILLRGCRPLTPPTFLKKSGQKTFNYHRRHLAENPNEVSPES